MSTTSHHVPILLLSPVMHPVLVSLHRTFVKSIASAVLIVRIDFLVAVARLNVTPSNVRAIWLYESVTLTCVRHVEQISLMYQRYPARMLVFREDFTNYCSWHHLMLQAGGSS
uniref:Uncharacterized protein n=1 Tax=Cacopsylla melanoneura TaxID=428564 RepID=A0A8D8M4C3_9HEMI